MAIVLTGDDLILDDLVACARGGESVEISDDALETVAAGRAALAARVERGERIYGVNTGFGALADERVAGEDVDRLQDNLVRSHAFGVGDPADRDEVRATMLVRLNSLLSGRSGVRPVPFHWWSIRPSGAGPMRGKSFYSARCTAIRGVGSRPRRGGCSCRKERR